MSKGNSAIKVLKTALRRVQKGWIQHHWSFRDADGNQFVCLEGAIFGYCDSNKHGMTKAQKQARDSVLSVIHDRYNGRFSSIPDFNDQAERTQDEVQEVIKLGIIRLETSDDDCLTDEEVDDLLDFMSQGD